MASHNGRLVVMLAATAPNSLAYGGFRRDLICVTHLPENVNGPRLDMANLYRSKSSARYAYYVERRNSRGH